MTAKPTPVTDLSAHADTELLTAAEIAVWLQTRAKTVRRMPLRPVPLKTRPRRYLAGDVKDLLLGRAQRAELTLVPHHGRKAG